MKAGNVSVREEVHRQMAIEITKHIGIFGNDQNNWTLSQHAVSSNATEEHLAHISMWHNLLQSAVDEKANASNTSLPKNANTTTIECSTLLGDLLGFCASTQ